MTQSLQRGHALHPQYVDFLTEGSGHHVLPLTFAEYLQNVWLSQKCNDLQWIRVDYRVYN